MLLEHTSDDRKNWKFGTTTPNASARPSYRSRFPVLFDARFMGDVVFRTSNGKPLVTHADRFQLHTDATDTPVRLDGIGSYNGVPIRLEADLASLEALRDGAMPYAARIYAASGDTTLHFQGTMTKPLDLDGAKGQLEIVAPTATALLRIAGASGDFDASLRLIGPFEHEGPIWHVSRAVGVLNEDTIAAADLTLIEGSRGKPDDLTVDLVFDRLDLNALLAIKKKGSVASADVPLIVDRAPDTLVTAKVAAHTFIYAGIQGSDLTVSGSLKPGRIAVDVLSLNYLGAPFLASGQIDAVPGRADSGGGHVTANVDMTWMDIQALRKLLAVGDLPLLGRVDGKVLVDATGSTLNAAAHGARLSAVFAMDNGSISRQFVELASTDARMIFRKAAGMSAITCLVGVVDIRGGIGTVSPLRIRSADGTITGRGSFDIFRHEIDFTVASEAATTGLFALDVPMRVTGSFTSPTIRPATLSAAGRAELSSGDNVSRLLPGLQSFARRSPCLSAHAP